MSRKALFVSAQLTAHSGIRSHFNLLHDALGDTQLGQHLESLLKQILNTVEARSLSVEQAQTTALNRLRADLHSDVNFRLQSNVQEIVGKLDKSIRENLSGIGSGQGCVSEPNRRVMISLARNVASLR